MNKTINGSITNKEINKIKNDLAIKYYSLFTSDTGKKVVEDLKDRYGYDRDLFDRGSNTNTAFLLGQRSVVLHIIKSIGEAKI